MGETIILGYRVRYRVGNVFKYVVNEEEVNVARRLLYEEKIPHAVSKETGVTGLTLYTTRESAMLENKLRMSAREWGLNNTPHRLINAILTTVVRLKLMESGWVRAANKMYDPRSIRMVIPLENPVVNVYEAVKLTVDSLISERKILFIDPASKLEFNKTLVELEKTFPNLNLEERVTWVKPVDSTFTFYTLNPTLVRKRLEETGLNEEDYVEKALDALKVCLDLSIEAPTMDQVIYATPKSLWLNNCLNSRSRGLPTTERGYNVVIPLPRQRLVPVGSLDNVSLFGKVKPLVRPPGKRVEVVSKLVDETGLSEINYGDLELSIEKGVFVKLDHAELRATGGQLKAYIEVEKGGIDDWEPVFNPNAKMLILLVKLRLDSFSKLSRERRSIYDKLCGRASALFEEYLQAHGLNGVVHIIYADLSELRGAFEEFVKGDYDYVFSVLLYTSEADPLGRIIGGFEYEAITNKVYPHVIDLTDLMNERDYLKALKTLRFKVLSIMKDFAVRTQALPHRLKPPKELSGAAVIGLDATVKSTRKGYLYPAAAVVLLRPEGTHEVYLQTVGTSDTEALVSALRNVVRRVLGYYEKAVAVVNRVNAKPILDKLGGSDGLIDELNTRFLLSTVSKTHSYSRILKHHKGRFVNPSWSDVGSLVKLKPLEVHVDGRNIYVSRFLTVASSIPEKGGAEVGTVVPVAMSFAGNIDHVKAAEYLIALTRFAKISYIAPSLPWPLRRADRICKRVHRILDSMVDVGAVAMLQDYVKYL